MAPRPQHAIPRLLLITLLSFFSLFRNVAGYIQQHIVDDADSSIQYSPNGWTKGNLCAVCAEGLDLDQIHGKTWTNGSTLRGSGNTPVFFTFSFTGVYLDIVFIAQAVHPISNSTQGVLNDANATVTVDGERFTYSKQLVQGSDKNQLIGYTKSLYAQGWTVNGKHDVRVDLAPLGSTLSLDYIAYSVEVEDEVSPTSGVETAITGDPGRAKVAVVGIVTGVLALVALAAFFAWWHLRRRRAAQRILQPIDDIIDIVPSGVPPAGCATREKAPFPSSNASSAFSLPPMESERQRTRTLTFTSSASQQPRLLSGASSSSSSSDDAQSGAGPIHIVHVQAPHPTVPGLQLGLGNQLISTPTTTVPLSSPTSVFSDMDVPPPAYSPPQSRD